MNSVASFHLREGKTKNKIYEKSQSFDTFISNTGVIPKTQLERAVHLLKQYLNSEQDQKKTQILNEVLRNLTTENADRSEFKLTVPICDELAKIPDEHVPRYLYHRYRYDIFPAKKLLDNYPTYLQIEPTSICNFRCVFCYQTDVSFTAKDKGHMGTMSFNLFKELIDQADGHIDFLSLASRGEPLVCKDIDSMLKYCLGKFLSLKLNTNASLLTEKLCHSILAGGVNTLVFSADAAEEPLYSKLRVNGKLQKILDNIKMFRAVKEKHYASSEIITRVSGVRFSDEQSMPSMIDGWGPIVDQVCFVKYNPWENVYESLVNQVSLPCTDLWRRMFVWFDGTVNPCDTDYKSTLSVGNIKEKNISELWLGEEYESLRKVHLANQRQTVNPCRRCTVV